MKNKLMRYVLNGPWEAHMEQGFRVVYWVGWATILLAAVVFGPVVCRIFLTGGRP
jgi:hypothetical protein